MTPSNLLKCQTPLVKTAQCAAPDGGVCLCMGLRPLIPQACLVPFSLLILINETFSPWKEIWEMTAILVLESAIAPRDFVKKCDLTLTVIRQVLRLS